MFEDHWSSCALHSGPAKWPHACDCGGITSDRLSGRAYCRWGYTPALALRRFGQLWMARKVWLYESHASPLRFLQRAAIRLASRLRRCLPQEDGARRSVDVRHTRTR